MLQPFPSHCTLHVILHSFVTLISRGPGVNSLNGSGLVLDSSQANPRLDRAPISPQSLLLFNTFRKRANRNSGDRKPEFNSFKPCKADDKPTRISDALFSFCSQEKAGMGGGGGGCSVAWLLCFDWHRGAWRPSSFHASADPCKAGPLGAKPTRESSKPCKVSQMRVRARTCARGEGGWVWESARSPLPV